MADGEPPRTDTFRIGRIGRTIPVLPHIDGSLDGATVPVAATNDISTSINVRHEIQIGGTIPVLPRTDGQVHDQNVTAVIEN